MNTEARVCKSCKNQFTIEPDDFGFYEQMHVPPPTWCPQCRLIRRLGWTGYRILYKRKCAFTNQDVLSIYHPDSPQVTYRQDIWWSDQWDPKSYGREYDFSKPFFTQFQELLRSIPLPALHTEYSTLVRSEYCNAASELKNCYLCFMADRSENCAYLNSISFQKESFDLTLCNHDELCYQGLNLNKCFQTFFSQDCNECHNVYFSVDLVGCTDCIGCIGLRKKQYCIFNEQYSKEEYEKKFKEFDFGSHAGVSSLIQQARAHFLKFPRKQFHGTKVYNSTGDYLYNCENAKDSYWVDTAKDVRYCQLLQALNTAQCYDYSGFAFNAERLYEASWVGISTQNVKFAFWNYSGHDSEYVFGCHSSGNVFGSVGLRKAEYCILNKQYSKEEYHALVAKIKKQMDEMPYVDRLGREYRYGEFFPGELSPWAYNESRGYEYFPMTKEEAVTKGFSWRDPDQREYKEATIQLPDHIKDVKDDILKAILKCDECGKNYQIISMELQFLRRFNFPIPRHCPLCRLRARIKLLNPMATFDRTCAKCSKPIKTSYASDRPEIVYCESCYQQAVV